MRVLALLAVLWAGFGTGNLLAQEAMPADATASLDELVAALPPGLTPEQVDALVLLADEDLVREALRERLMADLAARALAAAPPDPGLLAFYGSRLRDIGAAWPLLPTALEAAFDAPLGVLPPIRPGRLLLMVIGLLACGGIAMAAAAWTLRGTRRGLGERTPVRGPGPLGATALWLLLDACLIGAFFVGALAFYVLVDPTHPLAPEILSQLCGGALVALVVERVLRLLTAPGSPARGLTGLSPEAGRGFYRVSIAAGFLLIAISVAARLLDVLGLPPDMIIALAVPAAALPFILLIVVVWARGRQFADAMPQMPGSLGGQGLRGALSGIVTAYLAGVWLLAADAMFRGEPWVGLHALESILLAVLGALFALSLRRALTRFYVAEDPETGAEGRASASAGRLMGAAWLVVGFAVVYLNAALWDIDLEHHLGVGSAALRLLFNVALVVLVGFVVWSLAVNAIDRALARTAADGDPTRAQRLRTLLPLLRRFLQIVIVSIIAMVVLSSLGVEIGPLLAGAGVVGIAIGLGAQQTIADIIAGVLFLMDDAFRVGEYVEVGDLRGRVEGISLRCLKLRHHRGAIHTLPFGQMKSLTNYTRDWALMRLEFRVAAETDPALVKRLVKEISKELLANPELGPHFIEPLKSQGIRSVEDGAAVFGVKFIAKPGEQFVIRREAYQRILAAFRDNGIELVGRGVVVKVEGADAHQEKAVAAAASDILEQGRH